MPIWITYSWTIVINLIAIGVAVAIYGRVSPGFETIEVSLLVLIYLSVQGFCLIFSKTTIDQARGLDEEFKRIRTLLHNEPDLEEKENFKELEKLIHKTMVKAYINGAGQFIIYLVTLFNLLAQL